MHDLLAKLGITEEQLRQGFPIHLESKTEGILPVVVSAKNLKTLIEICNESSICDDCSGWANCNKPESCPLRMYAPTIEKCTERSWEDISVCINRIVP